MPSALPPAVAVAESTWGSPEPTLYFDFEDYVQNQLGVDLKGENKKAAAGAACRARTSLSSPARGVFRGELPVLNATRFSNVAPAGVGWLGFGGGADFLPAENGVCKFYLKASCARGAGCPYKHSRLDRSVVCKHWLRGLCKKGDLCEFLHQYNLKKMPECWFYTKYGECSNGDECLYLHVDPDSRTRECPWYNRGFC
ncbi:MAG: hypothetical protein BJ554DRAFT_4482, partial [Olpidium bornovanus]